MVLVREKVESGMRSAKIQMRSGAVGNFGGQGGGGSPEVRWMGRWWAWGPAVAGRRKGQARCLRSNRQPLVINEHADEGEGT